MAMTDPIADMLTRIRNAIKEKHQTVDIPASKEKLEILRIFKEEGYIKHFELKENKQGAVLNVKLKYLSNKQSVVSSVKRISKPSLRVYVKRDRIPDVLNGMGHAILSTSKGVLTGQKAAELGVGGEVICIVY
jgi:small subunit ribosomal protein S8